MSKQKRPAEAAAEPPEKRKPGRPRKHGTGGVTGGKPTGRAHYRAKGMELVALPLPESHHRALRLLAANLGQGVGEYLQTLVVRELARVEVEDPDWWAAISRKSASTKE